MKKKPLIILQIFGSLIIATGFLAPYVRNAAKYEKHRLNSITTTFSYNDQVSKKEVGFNNIQFKQFEIYNQKTNKYEYYLNEHGRKYLIQRFMQTALIGPEISVLKEIVIANRRVIRDGLGAYFPIAGTIFINPLPFFSEKNNYQLWSNNDPNQLSEKRAEAILATLVHEYSHHLFNIYASSPIGFNKYINDAIFNIKETHQKKERRGLWNKFFYQKFAELFFTNGVVNLEKVKRIKQSIYNRIKDLTLSEANSYHNPFAQYSLNSLYKLTDVYQKSQKLYEINRFRDVRNLFNYANEKHDALDDDNEYLIGVHFGVKTTNNESLLKPPILYKINYKRIYYHYSIDEQVVRKLLLSIFKRSGRFPNIDTEYWVDNYYSNDYIASHYTKNQKDNWYRFYSDNVFPAANSDHNFDLSSFPSLSSTALDPNRARSYIETIIDQLIGHKEHAELSFIATKNSWRIISNQNAYSNNVDNQNGDYDLVKLGGYIDTNEYNYIGFKTSADAKFLMAPVKTRPFNIWYKDSLTDQTGQPISGWKGNNQEYYWYTTDFINKAQLLNKKLYFLKVDANGQVTKTRKLVSVRANNFGIASNFNFWMTQDKSFVRNVMGAVGSGPKWLLIGKQTNDGVKMLYYDDQEIVEKIWRT